MKSSIKDILLISLMSLAIIFSLWKKYSGKISSRQKGKPGESLNKSNSGDRLQPPEDDYEPYIK